MDKFLEYLESALINVRGNKMRTGLTMLGIIIGIASVIAVITIGNGMSGYVSDEISSIGGNIAQISVDTSISDRGFTSEDIDVIKETYPELLGAAFYASNYGMVKGTKGTFDAAITGANSDYQYDAGTKVEEGTYFTEDQVNQAAKVCVIMETDAEHLFGTKDALGKTVEVTIGGNSVELEVIGIKENWSEMIMEMMELEGYSASIVMPLTTYANAYGTDISDFSYMDVYWAQNQSDEIVKNIVRLLENRMGIRGQDAISQFSMSDVSQQVDSIMGSVTAFVTLVAAISLLVGGIGVMNIMLVSVTERTREIGIRKSIGARTGSIMIQFLAESAIISLMGGVVGVILGIAIAEVGAYILEFSVKPDPVTIIVASLFSMTIGLFFGIYPARKAAKLRPIDALSRN